MDLYQAGIPIAYIAEVLGHSSITTTSGFYAFATLETLHEAFKKGIPEAFEDEPIWKKKEVLDRLYTI
jgi:integrase/recombinase XerD